ncbi:MAG: UDP-4-amino-4,6-dideoxy-N-acetyl-beta-L-altrosamine transaminase [Phycisphaerales bacterium]|nr:UDP-4-amino-4,6-dideoxy-N-acetyl-beta-L-altrosamine transaminase [Phycisphaerales bacterium]
MIPYGRQHITEDDVRAVLDTLQSDWLTQGPAVPAFEAAITTATGTTHAVAGNSATSCLHMACLALGLGPGGRLWTSPNTFVASANVGLMCGAEVDFVDIDPGTYCMCANALAEKLEQAQRNSTLPTIVMPVHFAGQCADMTAIAALADRYGFKIIEDAAHAIGGSFDGAPVGNCAHSNITVFSFHPVKIVTTAEGGCATTNDAELAKRMQLVRTHGVTKDTDLLEGDLDGDWAYQQVALGWNYRMTDLQAALGVSQMQRLNAFVGHRHTLARRYESLLDTNAVILPHQCPRSRSALHLFPVQVDNRTAVFNAMRAAGIGVQVLYIPVHTQPFWRRRGFTAGDYPNAEAYYARSFCLPMYHDLTEDDQTTVASTLLDLVTSGT